MGPPVSDAQNKDEPGLYSQCFKSRNTGDGSSVYPCRGRWHLSNETHILWPPLPGQQALSRGPWIFSGLSITVVSPGTLTSLGHPRLYMQGHQEATFNSRKKQRESKHTLTSPISDLDLRIPSSDPGMMAHACHSNNWRVQELETGASDIQAHPWLRLEI